MEMWSIWLIVAGFFFILEIATTGFLVCWLGVGALFAMVLSFFVDNIVLQVMLFAISSVILILFTKPLVNKFIDKKTIPTNIDSIIGKEGFVIETIDPVKGVGQVKLGGEVWSAKSFVENTVIEKDTRVVVREINGVKLVVEEVKKVDTVNA